MKKLILSVIFIFTALFSGLNHSIYAQAANTVELETLNQGQVKNIIRVNSEDELPTDGTTYTLVYSKQHCKLTDEIEKTSEATQKKTIESAPQTTTLTTVLKAQAKQSLPQTGTQQSLTIVLTAGVLVALAFLMIKYHKKKVWMVLLITASVTSLYNLRNVMAENETKITTIPVTTFVPTSDHCLYGYIIIPNTSETTKGESLVYEKPEFKGEVPRMPEAHKKAEVLSEKGEPLVQPKLPEYEVPTTTTAGTSTEATVTTATTTTSTEPTTTTASAVTIAESNVEASSDNAKPTTEAISNTNTSNNE